MINFRKYEMLKNILVILSLAATAFASGQVTILQSPKSLDFKGTDGRLDANDFGQLVSASIGRSIQQSSDFNNFFIKDVFNTPDNVVVLSVNGGKKINFEKKLSYSVVGDDALESLEYAIDRAQEDSLPTSTLDLSEGVENLNGADHLFADIKVKTEDVKTSLKLTDPDQKLAIEQIAAINAIADALQKDNLPAILHIHASFDGLLADTNAYNEATRLFVEATAKLVKAAQEANDKVLVLALTNKAEHKRLRRAPETDSSDNKINLAPNYNQNFPAIFNIILWFFVLIAFSLLAICYAIATMDPGRDSIIYRMTSTRIKKEN